MPIKGKEANGLEKATETDAKVLFETLFKPIEALQKLLSAEAKRLSDDNVDVSRLEIELTQTKITIRIGSIVLWHEIHFGCFDLSKNEPTE